MMAHDTSSSGHGCIESFLLIAIGMILGGVMGFGLASDVYKQKAIKHNAARFNSVTAEFEWITPEKPTSEN